MERFLGSTKGVSGGAIAAVLIVLVIVGVLVFASPGLIGGLGGTGSFTGIVGSGTQGVTISLTKDTVSTEKDIPVVFTLRVDNKGEKEATNVRAILFGLPDNEWIFEGGSNFNVPTTLYAANPINNEPGFSEVFDKQVTPTATKLTDTTYTVRSRLTYDYSTTFEGNLQVASRDFIRSQSAPGTTQPGVAITSSKYTLGPLSITARTSSTNLNTGSQNVRVTFDIVNVGGGRVFERGSISPGISNLDKIKITGSSNTRCDSVSGSTRLIDARTKTVTCEVSVNVPSDRVADVSFGIIVEYSYFVDSATQLTLLRTPQ